jgi:hypothetical protein
MEEIKKVADWIETELRRQFRPVTAPDALWDRIHQNRPCRVAPTHSAWRMPVLATLLVLLSAGLFVQIRNSHASVRDMTRLTDHELRLFADPSTGESFPSDDPVEIRHWIKAKGNIDIELPTSRSAAIRLLGAKLVSLRGNLIAAVAYSIGKDSATLLVSRRTGCCNATAGSRHLFSKVNTPGGRSLFSWDMKEQTYTIAYAGANDPQGGCLLCHVDAHGRRL